MEHTDDLLAKAYRGELTKSQRRDIVDQYKEERMQSNSYKAPKGQVLTKEDPLNMPRHRKPDGCRAFQECPLCYKCRSYDSSHVACRSCPLAGEGSICNTNKHNEFVLNMMIRRERIDLDANKELRGN